MVLNHCPFYTLNLFKSNKMIWHGPSWVLGQTQSTLGTFFAYNMMSVSGPLMLMSLAQCDCCAWPNMFIGSGSIHTLNLFKSNMIIGPGPSWVLGLAQYPLWARPNMFIGPGPIHTLNLFKSNMMIGPGPSLVLGLALSDYWARPNNDIELAYFW